MAKQRGAEKRPLFGGFVSPDVLWDETTESRLFNSEPSWRWFLRQHRAALIDAKAILRHTGQDLVHPKRVEKVAQKVALAAVRRDIAASKRGLDSAR